MIKFKVYDKDTGDEITGTEKDSFYLDMRGGLRFFTEKIMDVSAQFWAEISMPEVSGELFESDSIDPETELAMRLYVENLKEFERPERCACDAIEKARIFFEVKAERDAEGK